MFKFAFLVTVGLVILQLLAFFTIVGLLIYLLMKACGLA